MISQVSSYLVLVVIGGVIFVILYLLIAKKINKKLSDDDFVSSNRDRIDALIAALNETVDFNVTIVESKIKDLKALVEVANRKIALLEKESKRFEVGKSNYTELSKKKPVISAVLEVKREEHPVKIDRDKESRVEERPAYRAQDLAPLEPSSKKTRAALIKEVKALFREGKEAEEIAQCLELSQAETQLIISMATGGRARL